MGAAGQWHSPHRLFCTGAILYQRAIRISQPSLHMAFPYHRFLSRLWGESPLSPESLIKCQIYPEMITDFRGPVSCPCAPAALSLFQGTLFPRLGVAMPITDGKPGFPSHRPKNSHPRRRGVYQGPASGRPASAAGRLVLRCSPSCRQHWSNASREA